PHRVAVDLHRHLPGDERQLVGERRAERDRVADAGRAPGALYLHVQDREATAPVVELDLGVGAVGAAVAEHLSDRDAARALRHPDRRIENVISAGAPGRRLTQLATAVRGPRGAD